MDLCWGRSKVVRKGVFEQSGGVGWYDSRFFANRVGDIDEEVWMKMNVFAAIVEKEAT